MATENQEACQGVWINLAFATVVDLSAGMQAAVSEAAKAATVSANASTEVPGSDSAVSDHRQTFRMTQRLAPVRHSEARLQFLIDLADRLRAAGSPSAATRIAAEALGKYLVVGRAGYGHVGPCGQVVSIDDDWTDGSMESLSGEVRILDVFGPAVIRELREGRPLVVADCHSDPRTSAQQFSETWRSIGTSALIVAPINRANKLVGLLHVHSAAPRSWRDEEVSIVEDVASRTWSAWAQFTAEEALRRSEAQKTAILDAALDAVISIDAHGEITEWNSAATTIFGYTPQEIEGKLLEDLIIPPEHREAHRRGLTEYLRTGYGAIIGKRLELQALRSTGERIPVELTVSAIRVGGSQHFTAYVRDLTDQKRLEQAAKGSEERLRDIADALPVLISYVDKEQRFQFANKAYETWFGRPLSEVVGRSLREVMSAEVYEARKPFVERALAGERMHYDIVMPREDGDIFTEVVHIPHFDAEGRVAGFYALVHDITARKATEAALRRSEQKFRDFADHNPAMIWSSDPLGKITYLSDRWFSYTGIAREGPFTRSWDDVVHEADRTRMHDEWAEALATAEVYEIEVRLRRHDGTFRWHLIRAEPLFDEAKLVGWLGTNSDIDATVKAREERKQDHDRLWRISQELMLVRNSNGIITSVNPSAKRILGWEPEQMEGRSIFEFMHPDDHAHTIEQVTTQTTASGTISVQNRYRCRDGSYRLFDWRGVMHDGYLHAVGRDITAEVSAAKELKMAEDALRQSQKIEAIGQLTGGIAHDFNNMLAGIVGSLDIMKRRIAAGRYDDIDRFMSAALTSANRAATLTQRLLAFGRRQSLDIKAVDVATLLRAFEEMLVRTLGPNIQIRLDIDDDLWPAETDPNQLESAILNLAINARDAMPNGGVLAITARCYPLTSQQWLSTGSLQAGDYVAISVTDDGEGMTREALARAFEPFFTTKPAGHGTGLGLPMVHGFLSQTGGGILLESNVGLGTTATMLLRRSLVEAQQEISAGSDAESAGSGERIVVVEDDLPIRMLITEVLTDVGYRVQAFETAEIALGVIKSEQQIDLLVSDIGLPGMSGRQLADIALAERPNLHVLFITGYAENATRLDEYLTARMHMIKKPFRIAQFAEKVGMLLKQA